MNHKHERTKVSTQIFTSDYEDLLKISGEQQQKSGVKITVHDLIRVAVSEWVGMYKEYTAETQ